MSKIKDEQPAEIAGKLPEAASTASSVSLPQNEKVGLIQTPAPENSTPHPRTAGLKIFDFFLYPVLTNFVVFGISVAATYLTSRGGDRNPETGKLVYGKMGDWFHARGTKMDNFFKRQGMTQNQAEMSRMVFFSFADGTAVAPLVKLFEDRREKISNWIDKHLGTSPEDELAAYKAEPKQSWFSVIAGRLGVASIVVPTAVALDKTGLNNTLFKEPGLKFGQWVASKPNMARHFRGMDIAELGKVGAFELFYTSVCTAGLYYSSRFLANLTSRKKSGEIESIVDGNGHDILERLPKREAIASTGKDEKRFTQSAAGKALLKQPSGHFTDLAHHDIAVERT